MGARALAAIGDRSSQWHWHQCAGTLARTQALWAFDLRYWSLLATGAFTLASAFGFALALRFERPPARVLRGRLLLRGPDKPFQIDKKRVHEAYKAVRSNRGAAGVDGQTPHARAEQACGQG